jgi:hypothetical protein
MARRSELVSVTPSAARLTTSLRDIGYDFPSAVADLVDNSIAAGATIVDVLIEFSGGNSRVFICDDGSGMSENGLVESLRFGSRRDYAQNELGRYGLGLKTASLSQCRSVTVVTRRAVTLKRIAARTLDLDLILDFDDWLVVVPPMSDTVRRCHKWLSESTGTVVVWEKLDRVLPEKNPQGGWARRRLESLTEKTVEHLSMVFHRFLEGTTATGREVVISVNGEKLTPWNPFALDEPRTKELPKLRFDIALPAGAGTVSLRRFVLPARERFSSVSEFERLSGPLKWNRQQGLYIYRADRLVQWGGWSGVRAIDEHTKLARAAVDFDTDLDDAFNINVAKMRVSLPAPLKQMLERPLHELCILANESYRTSSRREVKANSEPAPTSQQERPSTPQLELGLALRAAAVKAHEYAAFKRILQALREQAPDVAKALNL